jgi:O-antigen/teichoic acid export membrane protein
MRRSVFSNFVALASTQVAGRVIRFVYLAVIARHLDLADVGVLSYGTAAYITLAGIGLFGQDLLLATRVGRKPRMFHVVASHSLLLLLIALALVTTAGIVALWCTEPDKENRLALSVLMMAVVARGVVGWIRGCFVSLGQATWIPRYESAFRGAEALTGILLLMFGAGLLAICVLHVATWVIEAVMSWRRLARATGFELTRCIRQSLVSRYATVSVMLMLGPWLLLTFPQASIIGLRQIQADLTLVAQFNVAVQFVMTLFVVPVAFGQAMIPGVVRSLRTRNASDLFVIVTALKICLVLGAALAALATAAGPELVPRLFGQAYAPAGEIFALLMWALGPYAVVYVAVAALNAVGARHMATATATVMVTSQIALMVLLHFIANIDALMSVLAAFLVAAVIGMAAAIRALNRALPVVGCTWWAGPVGMSLACAAIASVGLIPKLWVAVVGCGLAAVGAASPWVFSRGELSVAVRKSGLGRVALVQRLLSRHD